MKLKEILKLTFGYPVEDKYLEAVMIEREIDPEEDFIKMDKKLWLAKADLYKMMALSATLSDETGSISLPDRELLLNQAEAIYKLYEPESSRLSTARRSLKSASHVW